MGKPKTPIVSIDLETTGLVSGYNEIFEIAMIKLDREFSPTDEIFHAFMRVDHPERFTEKAQEITGRTPEELMTFPEQSIIKQELINWLHRVSPNGYVRPLGQFYDGFDMKFLRLFLEDEAIIKSKDGVETVGTLYDRHITRASIDLKHSAVDYDNWIKYNRIPYKKITDHSLDGISKYCNVINPKAHSAIADAKTTAICYKRLLSMRRY